MNSRQRRELAKVLRREPPGPQAVSAVGGHRAIPPTAFRVLHDIADGAAQARRPPNDVDAMRYLSICSGIGSDAVAWDPLGWECAAFAEIEPQASAVLAHRHPDTPNHGDFTTIKGDEYGPVGLVAGGTPCQSFSVAGLRKGMDDDRGNLALEYCRVVDRTMPRWVVWENVPGVLSSHGGRDFGAIVGALVELGYGVSWRILDAQYVRVQSHPYAVPQRRRRVFLVGHLGDWRPSWGVLFEPESLRGDSPPRREAGKSVAALTANGVGVGGPDDNQAQGGHLIAHGGVAPSLTTNPYGDHESRENPESGPQGKGWKDDGSAFTLDTNRPQSVAFRENVRGEVELIGGDGQVTHSLSSGGGKPGQGYAAVQTGMQVRRITPLEAERLQGFPDGWTAVPYRGKTMRNGPRYRLLGNAIAINVLSWIGQRIAMMEEVLNDLR